MQVAIKSILILFFLMSMAAFLPAQEKEECSYTLEKAQKLFTEGKIRDVPTILAPCLEEGFNREERLSAYKLIILSYVADDNKEEAQRQMLLFLRRYPEYKLLLTDPMEFQYLYESFNTLPLFTIGLVGGMDYSSILLQQMYTTGNYNSANIEYNRSGAGFVGGLRISRYLTKEIDLNVEFFFNRNKYESVTVLDNFYTVYCDETDTRVLLPVSLTYTFTKVPYVQPYLRLGVAPGKMLNSFATLKGDYIDSKLTDKEGPDIDMTDRRSSFGIWALAGGGLRYKIPRGYLMLDVRYNKGFMNNVIPSSRQDVNTELVWKYNHLDNDYVVNNFQVTLGYSFIFYKPEKKKK